MSRFHITSPKFFIESMQVETLRNRSFYNLTIACIVIYENNLLTTLELDVFEGLVGLQVLVICDF